MNYELAKKLKDAGFAQFGTFGVNWFISNNNRIGYIEVGKSLPHEYDGFEMCRVPTLEDLIEACEGRMFSLQFYKATDIWRCNDEYEGSTPTEAVARLWIALNPKKEVI